MSSPWLLSRWSDLRKETGGLLSDLEAHELGRLAFVLSRERPIRVLEVGHYTGMSTRVILSSLCAGSTLVTIDHHLGDGNVGPSTCTLEGGDVGGLRSSGVGLVVAHGPFESMLSDPIIADPMTGKAEFDLVFYDAAHDRGSVEAFATLVDRVLAPGATLAWDDADWPAHEPLVELARRRGLVDRTPRPLVRGGRDKADPTTYTLAIWAL